MEKLTIEQHNIIHLITRNAEERIRMHTGLSLRLAVKKLSEEEDKTPERMMAIVASALAMQPEDVRSRLKKSAFVDLRKVCALLLKEYYTDVTSVQMAEFFNYSNHTSALHIVQEAAENLAANDSVLVSKYNLAKMRVESWIRD